MHVLFIGLALLAPLAQPSFTPRHAKNLSISPPCYAASTAYVADSLTPRIRRIITTGVRRFTDSRTLTAPACAPLDFTRREQLKSVITAQLGADATRAAWVNVESTDSTIVADHLERLARSAIGDSVTTLIHLAPDADLVTLAPRAPRR